MNEFLNLEEYLADSVGIIINDIVRAALYHPKEAVFMAQYALASKKAAAKRTVSAERGEHIPPFLIASITSSCNLHCRGCYARCNETGTARGGMAGS